MIDEPSEIAAFGRVDNGIEIDAKQIGTADARGLVLRLAEVGHDRPDHLPDVLYHHFVGRNRLHGKQSPIVNSGLGEFQLLLSELYG